MTAPSPRPALLESVVLEILGHPRYRGGYVPVWRILDAAALPLTPAAVRRSLERLEAQGLVEHRRGADDQIGWRTALATEGSLGRRRR